MAITEQDILNQIKETETDKREARSLVTFHKKAADEAESSLIAANIKLTNLKEQLRVHLAKYPHPEETLREEDIRLFREKYPELCNK